VLAVRQLGWAPEAVVTNMAAASRRSPFTGFLSNIGVLLMAVTAAICLFSASLARRDAALFLAVGLFTTVLFADDFLMLHSDLMPNKLGLPKVAAYAFYVAAGAAIGWVWRRRLFRPRHLALGLSLALLGLSVAVDVLAPETRRALVLEEGAKFVGYALWCAYWVSRAHGAVRAAR